MLEACFPVETALRREQAAKAKAQSDATSAESDAASTATQELGVFILEPLLPGQRMHLHVFEARYRALVRHALAGSCRFGMAYETRASTFRCCECTIEESQQLPGGRYHVTIVGRHVWNSESGVELGPDGFLVASGSRLALDALDSRERDTEGATTAARSEAAEGPAAGAPDAEASDARAAAEEAPAAGQTAPPREDSSSGAPPAGSLTEAEDAAAAAAAPSPEGADDDDNASLTTLAEQLILKLETWKDLVRDGGFQRSPRHLDDVMQDLGPMPSPEHPSRLALWAAALVNPLPGLGVAPEIRPLILRCDSARRRLKVATIGVGASIRSLTALQNSWWRRALRAVILNTTSKVWVALCICVIALMADRRGRDAASLVVEETPLEQAVPPLSAISDQESNDL